LALKIFVGRTFRSDNNVCSGKGLQAQKFQGLKPSVSFCLKSELKLRPTNPTTDATCSCFSPFDQKVVGKLLDDDADEFLLANTQVIGRGLLRIELGCWVGDNFTVNL